MPGVRYDDESGKRMVEWRKQFAACKSVTRNAAFPAMGAFSGRVMTIAIYIHQAYNWNLSTS